MWAIFHPPGAAKLLKFSRQTSVIFMIPVSGRWNKMDG